MKKKISLIIGIVIAVAILLTVSGCEKKEKSLYLPEASNDKMFTIVGGEN